MTKAQGAIVLAAFSLLLVVHHCARMYAPFTFLYYDPGWQAQAVISLSRDGDLDLRNQLNDDDRLTMKQVAAGANGEWFPAHEPLICFFALPFYRLFGLNGLLVFNIICSVCFALLAYAAAVRHAAVPFAAAAALLQLGTTAALRFSYSFSNDVFGAVLFLAAYLLAVERRFFAAGVLCGTAVLGRLPNAVAIPALLVIAAGTQGRRLRSIFLLLLGGLPLLLIFLAGNQAMFGSPFALSYERILIAPDSAGVFRTTSLYAGDFLAGLQAVLFDRTEGFFLWCPFAAAAIVIGAPVLFRRARTELLAQVAAALLLFVLFAPRFAPQENSGPFGGARYFLTLYGLITLALALALQRLCPDRGEKTAASADSHPSIHALY